MLLKPPKDITIVHRDLSAKEVEKINAGFDTLSLEEGVAVESTEPISVVAVQGTDFIGCATGLAHKNGNNYSGWYHLTDLFVDHHFRNQGIGEALLKQLEEKLATIGVQHSWLWTSGAAALRFYHRHGYTQFAELENWYSDGSSRIGLRKKIT